MRLDAHLGTDHTCKVVTPVICTIKTPKPARLAENVGLDAHLERDNTTNLADQ